MHDRVIESARPQMIGNYYEPYRIRLMDILAEYPDPIDSLAEVMDGRYTWDVCYDEKWETVRWA